MGSFENSAVIAGLDETGRCFGNQTFIASNFLFWDKLKY
jgi:hypothetical protein